MENTFLRDAGLLVIGAVISITTSIISESMQDKREDKKNSIAKQLELNHEISKDLGDRYYVTYELMKAKRKKDSLKVKRYLEDFLKCQEEWNQNIYSYRSLLRNYYGPSIENNFIRDIYNPMVDLGLMAQDTSAGVVRDTTFTPIAIQWSNRTISFVSSIYNLSK
jgi:hypothetical protein